MLSEFLKAKIHRAEITERCADYEGSITIDSDLMDLAGMREYERTLVAVVDTGVRFETYVMRGEAGSGVVCVNGAAANLVELGQKVIVMTFGLYDDSEMPSYAPTLVKVGPGNRPVR